MTRTLAIITGASRGLGQALAVELSKQFDGNLHLVLTARSLCGLQKTEELVQEIWQKESFVKRKSSLEVSLVEVDLGNLQELDANCNKIYLSELSKGSYSNGFLFNNAGSIGVVDSLQNISKIEDIQSYMNLNLISMIWLSKRFIKIFERNDLNDKENLPPSILVNISSLCALVPFKTMGLYCAGKAARNMINSMIATEHPEIMTLNYAPGILGTDMLTRLREEVTLDKDIKNAYSDAEKEGKIVQPRASAKTCIELVLSRNFSSGEHVDYWSYQ